MYFLTVNVSTLYLNFTFKKFTFRRTCESAVRIRRGNVGDADRVHGEVSGVLLQVGQGRPAALLHQLLEVCEEAEAAAVRMNCHE